MSQSPEQQNTGVLGRIGSWFSPWRGRSPWSPTGDASPTSEQAPRPEREEGALRGSRERKQQEEEEEEGQDSQANKPCLSKDFFSCEEDARPSAHRARPLSVWGIGSEPGGGPVEEGHAEQPQKKEEGKKQASENGNPALDRNASQLTHFSSSAEEGVVGDSDQEQTQAHTQTQAQTSRKLHVYLEETSVSQSSEDSGQEVVHTVKKSIQVFSRANRIDSCENTDTEASERKRTHLNPALVGVSLKSPIETQSSPELSGREANKDTMGRKNLGRRRSRKTSQGDGRSQENLPSKTQPTNTGSSPSDRNSGTSSCPVEAETHLGEQEADSSPTKNKASVTSPEGASNRSTFSTVDVENNLQDTDSPVLATLVSITDTMEDIEEVGDSLYRVERLTETPESKRRSMKVSHSEKFFAKKVLVNSELSTEVNNHVEQDFTRGIIEDTTKGKRKPEINERPQDMSKMDEDPKASSAASCLIADRINLFEGKMHGDVSKTYPRSADVSPIRKDTEKFKANIKHEQGGPHVRVRSVERGNTRSSSAPPIKGKGQTVRERVMNFAEACKMEDKIVLPQNSAMTGMSQRSTPSPTSASQSLKQDIQAFICKTATSQITKITSEPAGRETISVVDTPVSQLQTDSKTKAKKLSKTENVADRPSQVDPKMVRGDLVQPTPEVGPHTKTSGRSGSRPKRRKNKDPTSLVSNSIIKPELPNTEQGLVSRREKTGVIKDISCATEKEVKTVSSSQPKQSKDDESETKKLPLSKEAISKSSDLSDKHTDLLIKKDDTRKLVEENRESAMSSIISRDNKPNSNSVTGKLTDKTIDIPPTKTVGHKEKAQSSSVAHEGQSVSKDKSLDFSSASVPQTNTSLHGGTSASVPTTVENQPKDRLVESLDKNAESEVKDKPSGNSLGPVNDQGKMEPEAIAEASKSEATSPKSAVQVPVTTVPSLPLHTEPVHPTPTQQKNRTTEFLVTGSNKTARTTDSDKHIKKPPEEGSAKSPKESQHETLSVLKTEKNRENDTIKQGRDPAAEQTRTNKNGGESTVKAVTSPEPSVDSKNSSSVTKGLVKTNIQGEKVTLVDLSVLKKGKSSDDTLKQGQSTAAEQTTSISVEGESYVKVNKSPTPPALDSNKSSPVNKAPANTNNQQERQNPVAPAKEPFVGLGPRPSEELDMVNRTKNILVKTVDPDDKNSENIKVTHASGQLPTEMVDKDNMLLNDKKADGGRDMVQISSSISTNTTTSTTTGAERPEGNNPGVKDPAPIGNGKMPPPPSHRGATKKSPNKATKPPPLTEPTKQRPAQDQRPSLNELLLPRGSFGDGSSQQRDTPSSWLDIDQRFPAQKLRSPEFKPKLSCSVSESNLTLGELEDDFIQNIKKFGAPFSLPPRKHSHLRPPQPPFAMPAIREDRFEKSFDPENFTFGLRKKREFSLESPISLLTKIQSVETDGEQKPARTSIADRSMLCRSMDTRSKHLQDREITTEGKDKEQGEETKEKEVKVKPRPSRLEGSCIFNSLKSSRTKRGGDVSPSNLSPVSPITQPAQPFPTSPIADHVVFEDQIPPHENSFPSQAVVSDSGSPLVSFNDIKLPEYLEKYLPKKPARPVLGKEKQQFNSEKMAGATGLLVGDRAEPSTKSEVLKSTGGSLPAPIVPLPTLPQVLHPLASPLATVAIQALHRRPGKMVLYEYAQFEGRAYEVFRNVPNATSLKLSPLISVKVVRGCWVLYEKPDFTGRCIALEEGPMDLTNVWAEPGPPELHPPVEPAMVIGSIRLAVCDYSIPHIDLFTEPEGHGRVVTYHDDALEICTFGILQNTASIKVHSGVWLVFSNPEYQGMLAVLEQGEYPCPEYWGFPSAFVGSLRPLKMGGFKVENPNEQKALVYEQSGFHGACVEIERDVFSFEDATDLPNLKLKSVGSLKILGGLWVGYEQPGFEGHQHVLEEGEYLDWRDWGGASQHLLSIRPILADFMSPHLEMFSERDFDELGANIDLLGPITNLEETGYGIKTQSVHVFSGVWVAFEDPGFSGEQYVLEKGLYGSPEDWAAIHPKISSVMPVMLDNFGKLVKFKVQLFSEPGFQGSIHVLEDSVQSFPQGFSLGSCRVLAGSWLAFEGEGFTERMYVLEEGDYPDLRSMGCSRANASILSLQITGFEFSVPSITLFERLGLRGRRVVMASGCVNLQLAGDCSRVQSIMVDGGMWVIYESINYRGAQILLKPGEVADYHKFSSWQRIGSLRPLIQKQVYFRLRNKQTGMVIAATGELDDLKLMRIQTMEETGAVEEIWLYQDGQLRSKLLEDCCLSPTSSMAMAGSRLGLSPPNPEKPPALWSITADGLILHAPTPDLLLEVKGGQNYDKNHVILNTFVPSKLTQRWTIEIL
ncbi:beta/gamma crystallin domain-containing protein 1-like isoform X2 [Osmerus eperlanus]|uniref:beta/gamma crystallin domain-containing protein 1-like isoform X2 n=1 Tax=Osmerus eperlanus TaxID=29151 RepID=UPI002E0DBA2B